MEGLSGRVSAGTAARSVVPSRPSAGAALGDGASLTSPTNRKPLRATVRIRRCSSPLSPIALRTALIWLVRVDSETIRPPQTASSRSSLLTTRSRLLHQIEQQVEDLRPDRDRLGPPGELPPVGIEHVVSEHDIARRRSTLRDRRDDERPGHADDRHDCSHPPALDKYPRQIQGQFKPAARSSGRLAGILRSHRRADRDPIKRRQSHEDRRDRRQRPHRNEAGRTASPEGPRGRGGVARYRASTPSPARGWPKRWRAPRSSSTWRTRRRSRTRRCWSSSRRPAATCSPRKRPPA